MVDARQHLLGYLALKDFVVARGPAKVMSEQQVSVALETDHEKTAKLMQRYLRPYQS